MCINITTFISRLPLITILTDESIKSLAEHNVVSSPPPLSLCLSLKIVFAASKITKSVNSNVLFLILPVLFIFQKRTKHTGSVSIRFRIPTSLLFNTANPPCPITRFAFRTC